MEVARLVGLEVREYVGRDGLQKRYVGLHLCHLEGAFEGVKGSKVEAVSCPRNVPVERLELGKLYELEYEVYDTRNGKAARLVDLVLVEE